MKELEITNPLTKADKQLIGAILASIAIVWTLYGNISAFYPPYCLDNHPTITSTMVGVVLA